MPAVVKSTVGSFSGIKEAEATIVCPLFLKNSRYFSLSSLAVIIRRIITKMQFFARKKVPGFPGTGLWKDHLGFLLSVWLRRLFADRVGHRFIRVGFDPGFPAAATPGQGGDQVYGLSFVEPLAMIARQSSIISAHVRFSFQNQFN